MTKNYYKVWELTRATALWVVASIILSIMMFKFNSMYNQTFYLVIGVISLFALFGFNLMLFILSIMHLITYKEKQFAVWSLIISSCGLIIYVISLVMMLINALSY